MTDYGGGTNIADHTEAAYQPGVPRTHYSCSKRCKAFVPYMVHQSGDFKCAYCLKYNRILERLEGWEDHSVPICQECFKGILNALYGKQIGK